MSAWSNNDIQLSKPKFNAERQTREVLQLTTANSTAAFANTIIFVGTGAGIAANQIAYAANLSSNGVGGMFKSNNYVTTVTGNVVGFAANTFGIIPAGTIIELDVSIPVTANKPVEQTYNSDTVLVTPTRLANNTVAVGGIGVGWVHIQKKINADGNTRYISETLVSMSSPIAANTKSGNTSFAQVFTGV